MVRRARRAAVALRLEVLEPRTLLSGNTADEFFVRFEPNVSQGTIQTVLKSVGASVLEQYPAGPMLISFRPGVDRDQVIQRLQLSPLVSYAEANVSIQSEAIFPNDTYANQLWALNNGNNVDIDAPEAWPITQGRNTTIVAVLDTGIDLANSEFSHRLWVNPTGASRADGFAGDYNGWNFINNNGNVQDGNGHGTHVAGILAATGNNGSGVAGVDWYSQIMPVKVLDNRGNGTTKAAISGIYYAVNNGAKVINASWGGGEYSQALHDAIAYAESRNVVFVTSAGNDGLNNDISSSYPGSYRLPNQITVGAIDAAGNLASFSDYGATTVDLVAPGVNILSTVPGGFASYSGTSMAAPFVAGVASLVYSLHPELTAPQIVQRILATAKPVAGAIGKTVTGGMVSAYNAVNFNNIISTTSNPNPGDAIPPAVPLVPNGTNHRDVLANLLATDGYYILQGGTAAGFVAGLYRSILGRSPEPEGLAHWVTFLNSGHTRFQTIATFLQTPEAFRTEVARWYQNVLGWTSPLETLKFDAGVAYWSSLLAAGLTENTVLAQLLGSDGYFQLSGSTNQGFINGLFRSLMGREADPQSVAYFLGLMQGGMSRFTVAQVLQTSPEAKYVKVAHWFHDEVGWPQSAALLKFDPSVQVWASFLNNA